MPTRQRQRLTQEPCQKPLDMLKVVRTTAARDIFSDFMIGHSVRALVKKWGLNAVGVEQLIRAAVR